MKEKLLHKITKRNSYIKVLEDAFKQAIEINRESSFVDVASGRYNEQNTPKTDTQINELDYPFQNCDINTMSTRLTHRSAEGSFNGSFDRSSSNSRNNSYNSSCNSSQNSRPNLKINTLFDTGAIKSVVSFETYLKLKLDKLNTTSILHAVGASGESLGTRRRIRCEVNINGGTFFQTFIVCEHLKCPVILGRDFSIQNCIGISWTKANTRQLTQSNEVIAETEEYQPASRATVSLKKNVKIPLHSGAIVDVDINSTEEVIVEIVPDELWLSTNPNICT